MMLEMSVITPMPRATEANFPEAIGRGVQLSIKREWTRAKAPPSSMLRPFALTGEMSPSFTTTRRRTQP